MSRLAESMFSDDYLYSMYLDKHARSQNKGARWNGLHQKDSEKTKTYRAEWTFQLKVEISNFEDIEEAQKFAKRIYKTKKWQKLWKKSIEDDISRILSSSPKIVAMNSRNKKMSGYTDGRTVTLSPTNGFNKYTLLHELAHCLGHMHHGRSFRQCVLELVGTFMGSAEKKLLKAEFKKSKLPCGEPRKPMTFPQWKAAKERMEVLREKRELKNKT